MECMDTDLWVTGKVWIKKGKMRNSSPPRTWVSGPFSVYTLLLHFLQQAEIVSRTQEHVSHFKTYSMPHIRINDLMLWPVCKITDKKLTLLKN